MVDDHLVLLAIRQRLLTLSVIDVPVDATPLENGFARVVGSFVADGFMLGMEVTPIYAAGRGTTVVVQSVTPSELLVNGTVDQGQNPIRFGVYLPEKQSWENVEFTPEDKRWFIEEDYLPGPQTRITLGKIAEFDVEPAYILRLYGLAGTGSGAVYKVAGAIVKLFEAGTMFPTGDGHIVRVRSDIAPRPGQLVSEEPSHAMIPITIPMRIRTSNA
jgi:hypothetical protein